MADPHGTSEQMFTPRSNPRLTFVIGVVLGVSIITIAGLIFIMYTLRGGNITSFTIEPLDTSSNILEEPRVSLPAGSDQDITVNEASHIYGATENYTTTLVLYIDYECRFCKKFYPNVLTFVDEHSDTVRLIVKHYPLTQIHPNAKFSALAAECAGQQDKFFEYSDILFARQTELRAGIYAELANELGLNVETFNVCVADPATTTVVEEHTVEALGLGVQSQPNLIVWYNDGSIDLIDGYVTNEYLEDIIADPL